MPTLEYKHACVNSPAIGHLFTYSEMLCRKWWFCSILLNWELFLIVYLAFTVHPYKISIKETFFHFPCQVSLISYYRHTWNKWWRECWMWSLNSQKISGSQPTTLTSVVTKPTNYRKYCNQMNYKISVKNKITCLPKSSNTKNSVILINLTQWPKFSSMNRIIKFLSAFLKC